VAGETALGKEFELAGIVEFDLTGELAGNLGRTVRVAVAEAVPPGPEAVAE
jgi:hypothetical protein